MSEELTPRASANPAEAWRQWYDATSRMWGDALGSNGGLDPLDVYRRWLEGLQDLQGGAAQGLPAGGADLYETWRQWAEATTETWRKAAEAGTRVAGLAVPRWAEMVQEIQKQMLEGGDLPTDPLDFYTRWYNATSGPLSKLADDILRDEAFLDYSRRLFDYYSVFDSIFRRASEEYFSNLQLPTSSDLERVAKLVVDLDARVDRVEEMLEEFEGYEERLDRIESRLEGLDRVESKLDQLLSAQSATTGGDQ